MNYLETFRILRGLYFGDFPFRRYDCSFKAAEDKIAQRIKTWSQPQ